MASKSPSPAMEFLVSSLKANRKASYADLKAKADEKKLKVFPIMFGRAQALLGIVKSAKRGTGKFARASAAKRSGPSARPGKRGRQADPNSKSGRVRQLIAAGMAPMDIAKKVGCTPALVYNLKSKMGGGGKHAGKRGPGRPSKVAASGSMDGLAGILDAVKSSEREKAQLRAALERIQGILADALG